MKNLIDIFIVKGSITASLHTYSNNKETCITAYILYLYAINVINSCGKILTAELFLQLKE